MKKRLISFLLVICMITTLVPAQVFAMQENDSTQGVPFTDISSDAWYYDAVQYVYKNGIFNGTSNTSFTPDGTMTRGMFVTVLGRMAGVDSSTYSGESSFKDVSASAYYAPFVAWAAKHGITSGTGDGKFSPDELINRQQMATFFVRYFEVFDVDYDTGVNITTIPADIDSVADYARYTVLKLWKTGLLNGDGVNFNPTGNASRAQAATLCMRTDAAVKIWYKEPGVPSDRVPIDPGTAQKPTQTQKPSESSDSYDGGNSGGTPEPAVTYYTCSFDTNGGNTLSDMTIREGRTLDTLPIPYRANSIFIGWCYDQELTQLVSSRDTAAGNLTLYAKYEKTAGIEEIKTTSFARALDQRVDFTIQISSPSGMTVEELKGVITAKNLSSNENKEWFSITKNGEIFTVSGLNYLGEQGAQQAGFVEGSAYKIILEDSRLAFVGQDASAREYNFTIARAEVVNVSLNDDLIYIPLAEVNGLTVNGQAVSSASIPVITVGVDGHTTRNGEKTRGSFTYTAKTLSVGDTVVIYSGEEVPTMDGTTGDEDTAFVEITGVSGFSYTYKGADMENVLFTPDILPVNIESDTDENSNDHSMTVAIADMTYTDDHFANMGLDSQTTIDVGDFIAFYSGTLLTDGSISQNGAMSGYAEITSVSHTGETYTITFQDVTLSQMQTAMAAYKKEAASGASLLEGVDVEKLERSVEQQARDSGFADEAGMYLAALALETDSFTQLSDEYELTAIEMTMNGQPITQETLQSMGGVKTEVELSKLQATLNTNLQHFEGVDGLRLTLDVGVTIKIQCNDNVTIEIEITGSFEQEVRIDIGVDGDAVWKWWGIFPYIAEYEVTAFSEFYEFTGIGIEATITTKETEEEGFGTKNEEIEKIGKQIKDLMDKKDKYLGDGTDSVATTLQEKYAEMLENESDWVTLFEKAIVEQEYNILLVIAISFEIKFVVSANVNISLGVDFWYENAKRYVYTIQIFANNVTSDIIDLVEEHYEFEFYVMGTMGLRAGIKLEVKVGLFSTKLASVGFAAEAGAYVRVWGYFYYQLSYTASSGHNSSCCGALLIELGVYVEVTFEAQALNGTFKYNPTLYENEWPILSAGNRASIMDFTYEQEEYPEIKLKQYIRTTVLSDDLFSMHYFDLKDGEENDAIYSDAENFTITMSNKKFFYNPATNTILVLPAADDIQLTGEMVITWKQFPLAFSSKALQRKVSLYWDNLRDGYAIAPYTNGGSYVPMIIKKYGEAITAPQNPTKKGYIFAGWYTDAHQNDLYTFPATMPEADVDIYAYWTPATDTIYTVEHYKQILGSSQYVLEQREQLRGTTDSTVTPPTKSYPGFRPSSQQELVIKPDGSSVLRYYYDLQTHTVTFQPGVVGGEPVVNRLKYSSTIVAPQFAAKGYIFKGWDQTVSTYMGEQDLTYTAVWEVDDSTQYRVEYYVQQPDGRYVLQDFVKKMGKTGEQISTSGLVESQYQKEGETTFENMTVNGAVSETATISADGSTVIKVNYKRVRHTVTFKPENGGEDMVYILYSGAAIVSPRVTREGYIFAGWSPEVPETLGSTDLTFTAQWDGASGTAYTVKHIREDVGGNYPTTGELVESEAKTGITEAKTQAVAKTYEGFTVGEVVQQEIKPDNSTVVEIKYTRNSCNVYWVVDGVITTVPVKYGKTITKPEEPVKQGYVLEQWLGFAEGTTMGTVEKTFTAKWAPATDTPYTVKHIREALGSEDPVVEMVSATGTTATNTATNAKTYEGFTAGEIVQQEIKPDGSTVVEIRYARNTYDITWKANDQTFETQKVKFGTAITKPEGTPSKTGYTFKQWVDVPEITPAKNLTITAEFTANTYSVTLDMDCELEDASITVTFDSRYGDAVPTPNRAGYRFERWMNADGNTVTASSTVKTAAAHTLTAVWTVKTDTDYSVKHMKQDLDGSYPDTLAEAENKSGTTGANTEAISKGYAGFTAPKSVAQQAIKGDGSTVVEIRYTRNSYSLTWVADGQTIQTGDVKYGATIAAPADPEKTGYNFTGWQNLQTEMPANNLTVTAQFTPCTYTVTFDVYGGSGLKETFRTVTYGQSYGTLPAGLTREGYNFVGWVLDESTVLGTSVVKTVGNHTLTALWDPKEGVSYQVHHYKQELNGEYGLYAPFDTQYGVSGYATNATARDYPGFTPQRIKQETINGNGSTIVSVYYDRNSYDVVWMADGLPYRTTSVKYGDTITRDFYNPEKTGYYFNKWDYIPATMPANQVTVTAEFKPVSYTVSFNANGGWLNGSPKITVTYDQLYSCPAYIMPILAGYDFVGWQTPSGQIVIADTVVKTVGDHTLTAVWSLRKVTYTVNYLQVGLDDTQTVVATEYYHTDSTKDIHTVMTLVPKYEYEGFTYPEIVANDATKVINLYYARSKFLFTCNTNGAVQGGNSVPISYGASLAGIITQTPTRDGYTFMGYEPVPPATMPAHALTIVAQWKADDDNEITLKGYNADGTDKIVYGTTGTTIALPTPYRTGYTFGGWYTQETGGEPVTSLQVSGNTTLYAHWTGNSYQVSFDLNGIEETAPESSTATYGTAYTLPTVSSTKTGYTFAGWFTADKGGTQVTVETPVSTAYDHILYAQWAPNKYTVTFDGNGAAGGTMAPQTHTYDQSIALTGNTFVKTGDCFTGWNTQSDGEGTAYADKELVSNLSTKEDVTLYAQWALGQYTITFNSDGTTVAPITQEYGSAVTAPRIPTKNGYSFIGWKQDGADGLYDFTTMPGKNITLTALWTPAPYNIRYCVDVNLYRNQNDLPNYYYILSEPITLVSSAYQKQGYTFAGWYTSDRFAEEDKAGSVAIPTGSYGDRTFYAKWTPNNYVVYFHSNCVPDETTQQTFTYDVAQPLASNPFTNSGYTFVGWSISQESDMFFSIDGQMVRNLAAQGEVHLYAMWRENVSSISYSLGGVVANVDNPTIYHGTTGEITLNAPTNIYGGYQFLGWIDSNGDLVETIQPGSTGNIHLTAKWAHGGVFSLSYMGTTYDESGIGTSTYRIKRNIPTGVQMTEDEQRVFYRTVNGTAIGGTAAAVHFKHVGGQAVVAIFTSTDGNGSYREFKVEGETTTPATRTGEIISDNVFASAYTSGVDRYYSVELYKLTSAQNLCAGTIDPNEKTVVRTLTQNSAYTMTTTDMDVYKRIATTGLKQTILENSGGGYDGTASVGLSAKVFDLDRYKDNKTLGAYIYKTATGMGVQLRNLMASDAGWGMYRFVLFNNTEGDVSFDKSKKSVYLPNLPESTKYALVYGVEDAEDNSDLYRVNLPAVVGTLSATGTDLPVHVTSTLGTLNGKSGDFYVAYGKDENCSITMGAYHSNIANSYYYFSYGELWAKPIDTDAPKPIGIAPMAFGQYQAGDTISISMVYDEIVADHNNVTLGKIDGLNLSYLDYVGGEGTNVLNFVGTLSAACEVQQTQNEAFVSYKSVRGAAKDIWGN